MNPAGYCGDTCYDKMIFLSEKRRLSRICVIQSFDDLDFSLRNFRQIGKLWVVIRIESRTERFQFLKKTYFAVFPSGLTVDDVHNIFKGREVMRTSTAYNKFRSPT